MATYGRGQMLGSGINPESFKQDFSGFANAAAIRAQGLSDLGTSIGGAISEVGDYFKKQKEDEKKVQKSFSVAKSIGDLIPDLKPTIQGSLDILNDKELPLSQRAAEADAIADILNLGINEVRNRQNIGLKEKELDIEEYRNIQAAKIRQAEIEAEANKPGPIKDIAAPGGGTQQMERNPRTGIYEPIKVSGQRTSSLGNLPDPLKPFAKDFETAGARYGVDPKLLAAIAMHETGNGTSSAFLNKKNAMGVSDASGPVKMGSVAESIDKMANLLGKGINEGAGPYANAKSIADIANIYAPKGAGNDPNNLNQFWTSGVTSNIEKLDQNQPEQVQTTTSSNQDRFGFTPPKPKITSKIVTGEEAQKFGGKADRRYEVKLEGDTIIETKEIPPDMTPAEERARAKVEGEKAETKRAGELAVKSINKFIDAQGNFNKSLDKAVGYGESFATGVAQYAPILQTQSPEDRANQKELAILVEKGILEAASLLKPVSNVDLLLLKANRPQMTDPPELWARWLKDVRNILDDSNSYAESSTPSTPEAPQSATDRLRAKASQSR